MKHYKLFQIVFSLILITCLRSAETKQIDPNEPRKPADHSQFQAIFKAAARNDIEKIKSLVSEGADVNVRDNDGYTPLFYAVWQRNAEMAVLFIGHGAEVNLSDKTSSTPLHYAVWFANKDMIKLLVEKGADISIEDRKGETPIQYAAISRRGGLIDLLLAGQTTNQTIHLAATKGDLAEIRSFIEKGTDIDTKDAIGWTPLLWAALAGQHDAAEFLISKGADINAKNQDGATALQMACRAGRKDVVELLIDKHADINTPNNDGRTALHFAASQGNVEIIKLLLDKGANVNATNQTGATPLHLACSSGKKDVVELIIEKNADVNAKDHDGWTALHIAALRGYTEIVKILLAKGADANIKNNYGQTALSLAKDRNHPEIIELLHNLDTHGQTLTIHIDSSQNSLNLKVIYGSDSKEYSTPAESKVPSKLEYLFNILDGGESNKEKYGDVNNLLSDLGECIYKPVNTFLDSASEINFIIKEGMVKYPFDLLRYEGKQLFLIKPVYYSFEQIDPHRFKISPDWTGFIASDVTADPERGCLLAKAMFPASSYFDVWAISPQDIETMENPDFVLVSTHGQISDKGNDVMTLGDEKIVPKNFSGKRPELVYFDSCNLGISLEFIKVFQNNGTRYYLGPILSNEAGDSSTKTIDFFFNALLEGSTPAVALFQTRKKLYETFSPQDDFYKLMWRAFPFRLYQLN
jgi:ankyrin repeat protein